jgi:polyphosphate kinase 2 (PPK2 family)
MSISSESPLDRTQQDIASYTSFERQLRFDRLDMGAALDRDSYNEQVRDLQLRMVRMQRKIGDYGIRVLLVFEGMDAAGKGGVIKRLTNTLDPRWVRVRNLSRPSNYDQSYFWMRRYWLRLPRRGIISIFDDYSWYARLLVEVIEGAVGEELSRRSASQIVEYERWLAEEGYCIMKFWPHISEKEQVRRFERRKGDPLRSWKLTPDDWQNNTMYERYVERANAMFTHTDAPYAPWHLVPANDKRHARVTVLETIVQTLERWPALSS